MVEYEIIASPTSGEILKRTDTDGTVWFIPMDPANADYQAYLNRDNPDWGKPFTLQEETAK
jgi:hypothetical protein